MKFDMSNFTSIFTEAAKENSKVEDKELENLVGDKDFHKMYDNICPISGEVFKSMKEATANPDNLKITMVKNEEATELYIEATEFVNFCEANDMNPGEAEEKIIDHYKESIPEMDNAEIHVVFPNDSLNKNILGSENLGRGVKSDWAMELMSGCRRYGIHANCVEK